MRIADLSHTMNIHTPGWVGYPGGKLYYTQTLQTNRIVSQRIETALHVGTHLDGALHAADDGASMADYALTQLIGPGVIVDVSDDVDDWDVITPKMITSKVEVRRGDILIIHTGWHRYYEGQPQQDLVRYFCMHPGGTMELAQWMIDMEISWWGIDAGSGDHPMNTTIRHMRPDLTERFEQKVGMTAAEFFGTYQFTHDLSGRVVEDDLFLFHQMMFGRGIVHAENIGGEIDAVLNERCIVGALPWKYEGLEACPCRILAFFDVGDSVEEIVVGR